MNPTAELAGAPIDPAVVGRAAAWMARLWSGEATDKDRAACDQWRAAHPEHERAWARLAVMEAKLHAVPPQAARKALLEPAVPLERNARGRRRALQVLGLAVVTGSAAYSARESQGWQMATADHHTATGEIRELALPDGTRLVMNTGSAIDVRYGAGERRLVLHTGEILVTTAPDPAPRHRPFLVESRHGTAEALGTRFTVRQQDDTTAVDVFEGTVEIRPRHATQEPSRIAAGQRARFSAAGAGAPVAAQESAAAWSRGMLVAQDMRVADFVAELGRYRPGLLRCDPAVAELRVTGVFPLRDTDRALVNLTLGLPLEVAYRTRFWVTVQSR